MPTGSKNPILHIILNFGCSFGFYLAKVCRGRPSSLFTIHNVDAAAEPGRRAEGCAL